MTRWPTWLEIHVCATPITPVTIAIAIMPSASSLSSVVSWRGIARSRTSRIRNGLTAPSAAEPTISASSPPRRQRYGVNRRRIRRSETGGATNSGSPGSGAREGGGEARTLRSLACGWPNGWLLTTRRPSACSSRSHLSGGCARAVTLEAAVIDAIENVASEETLPPVRAGHTDLSEAEARVLGCLIEKQRTTPDQYPLSLNALRLACNQSTNREPVTDYDEATVREAASRLSRYGLTRLASGHGSRATKYRHLAEEGLGLDRQPLALLCVLLLRG